MKTGRGRGLYPGGNRMKKILIVAAAVVLSAGAAYASEEMAKKDGCMGCHDVNAKKAGPSFKSVAEKNKGKADAEAAIVAKLGDPKKHPANKASPEDRAALAKWVLSQ
jgi:cytochrome c